MNGDIIIEAYDSKGQPILGNLDGQALLRGVKDFRRSNAYKRVKVLPKEQLSLNGRAVRYRVTKERYDGTYTFIEEIIK